MDINGQQAMTIWKQSPDISRENYAKMSPLLN